MTRRLNPYAAAFAIAFSVAAGCDRKPISPPAPPVNTPPTPQAASTESPAATSPAPPAAP